MMKKQLTVKNVFFALCATLLSLVLAFSVVLGLARTGNKVSADDNVTSTATTTARTYQGQDNWYYLTGDFEEDTLYRAYWNNTYSKWQGYTSYTNWIDPNTFNKLMPFGGTDAVMAYVVPDYGTLQIVGRVVPSLAASSNIDASIVWAHADGSADTVLFEQNITTAVGEQVNLSIPTQTVKAGDVVYFVASEGVVTSWDGIIFDARIDISEKQSGRALGNALTMSQMPMTGAHAITVTNGVVDYQSKIYDSINGMQTSGSTRACYLNPEKTAFGLLTAVENETDIIAQGVPLDSSSLGIRSNRIFFSNIYAGYSGMIYYASANGDVSILGKAVIASTAEVYKLGENGAVALVTTIEAGEKDFASIATVNNIQVNAGEAVAIVFVSNAWQTSSAAMVFDFYAEPTVTVSEDESDETERGMLSVLAQTNTTGEAIRFVTAVDSLDYAKAGFSISVTVGETVKTAVVETTTGYTSLLANGEKFDSTVFNVENGYLVAYTLTGVPANTEFTVRAYVVTHDGETIWGTENVLNINDGLQA